MEVDNQEERINNLREEVGQHCEELVGHNAQIHQLEEENLELRAQVDFLHHQFQAVDDLMDTLRRVQAVAQHGPNNSIVIEDNDKAIVTHGNRI